MFKYIESTSLEHLRYSDNLFVSISDNEEELMKQIYDTLSQNLNGKSRLNIIVDNLDINFLTSLLDSIDAIKSLGYKVITFEGRIHQEVNQESLKELLEKYGIPLKIKYYLSSSDDNLRKRLEEDIRIRIDPDLVNLSAYQDSIVNNLSFARSFKKQHHNLFVGEIVYELIRDTNASLFECALLQYYAKRYNLAVRLEGESDLVDLWIEEIKKYSPDICILNLNDKKKKNKVLSKNNG